MKLLRKVLDFVLRRELPTPEAPRTADVIREARLVRRDLHELRRLEIIAKRR